MNNRGNEHIEEIKQSLTKTCRIGQAVLIMLCGSSSRSEDYAFINKLAETVKSDSLTVDIFSPESLDKKQFLPKLPDQIRKSGLFTLLVMLIEFCRRVLNYDIVHIVYTEGQSFYGEVLPVIILAKFFGKKIIFDNRCRSEFDQWMRTGFIQRRILKLSDSLLVQSDYLKRTMNRIDVTKHQITEAVETSLFTPRHIEKVQPKILVYIEDPTFHNLNCVVRAFKMVKQKYPRTELVVAGDYNQIYNDIPGITFTDERDKSALFESVDIFINSTRYDLLEPSILEAMSSGLPVISSPLGMLDRLENRKNILFFKHNDAGKLADLLIELTENDDLVSLLSKSSAKTALEFDWKSVKSSWVKLYSDLIS